MLVPIRMGTSMASLQISINVGQTFLRISRLNCCDLSLGESLCIVSFFLLPDSGFYLISILIYFERYDTKNQQYQQSSLFHLSNRCYRVLDALDQITMSKVKTGGSKKHDGRSNGNSNGESLRETTLSEMRASG